MKVQPNEMIDKKDETSDLSTVDLGNGKDEVEPNSFIVMFRAESGRNQLNFSTYFDEYKFHNHFLSEDYASDPRIKKMQFISSENLAPTDAKGARFSDFSPTNALKALWDSGTNDTVAGELARIDFVDEESSLSFLDEADQNGKIWFAEPNYINKLMDQPVLNQAGTFEDAAKNYGTLASTSWMKAIALSEAMTEVSKSTTKPSDADIASNPPIVAVLDTGLDYEHPGLDGRVWTNGAKGAAGCADDEHGCDTSNPDPGSLGNGKVFPCGVDGPSKTLDKAVEECGHGTHVSGIIAGNFNKGHAGVCPVCQIMTLKVVEMQGNKPKVLDSAILTGMKYLNRFRRSGNSAVRVINSSFGKFSRSRSVGILVDVLKRDGKGTLLVGAAGNEDSMSRVYPAAFAEAIAVSALYDSADTKNNGKKARFSNFGPWVDIAAPGVSIESTVPGGDYAPKSGTSMACPVVAGALALFLAINPTTSADDLKSLVLKTADGGIYAEDYADGYNNKNYFKQIKGENFRRPLLGAGQLDVKALITGTVSDAYIGTPVDRVTPGCGTIATYKNSIGSSMIVVLIALLPMFLVFFPKRISKK